MIIFRADGTEGTLPPNCNITNGCVKDECNVYPASFFRHLSTATEPATRIRVADTNSRSPPPPPWELGDPRCVGRSAVAAIGAQ